MPVLRVVVLWHQHQPFYKDLVTGQYRLPWVRLHGLKDYYGMVKLLEEFPQVHQTFNLVPSLLAQLQDYVAGDAQDPFLELAAKPAEDLTLEERRFALAYSFQANPGRMIGRYPRYRELWERYRSSGTSAQRAERFFHTQDFTDLQVLSQIAWFDEFFLEEPEIASLIRKGRGYSREEQKLVIDMEREFLARVLPVHQEAARRGSIEISTSPFYHPILPLVADTDVGAVSSSGIALPVNRYRHPEDAREQLLRALDFQERIFGLRPRGVWPSEGSVSEEVLSIAGSLGVEWMATDEGVLGRSLGLFFARQRAGRLEPALAEKLYTVYQYENRQTAINLIFRDHALSDLIGFVYSAMPAPEAANHLMESIRHAAQPVLDNGQDALVPIILDGENAWEYYPGSGREFLRRFYAELEKAPDIEAVTVSEAIARQRNKSRLTSLVPGSWINANFNIWIGSREDNRAWDYLFHARNFYAQASATSSEAQRQLAWEEILIAEGSDWNWWYGPEHQSANDRDFDELYRKHLSNVYQALGASPPEYLAQPILGAAARPSFVPQSAYVRPRITGDMVRYFEWIGAAMYTADQRSGAMHGKRFLLNSVYAGIDETNVYGRLDFTDPVPESSFQVVVNIESWTAAGHKACRKLRLEVSAEQRKIQSWKLSEAEEEIPLAACSPQPHQEIKLVIARNFEFQLPLSWLSAKPLLNVGCVQGRATEGVADRLRLRFSVWQDHLPIDALPLEGWIELQLLSEAELAASAL